MGCSYGPHLCLGAVGASRLASADAMEGATSLPTNRVKSLLPTRPPLSIPAGKGMGASLLLGVVEVSIHILGWDGMSYSHYSWKWSSSLLSLTLTLLQPGNWNASLQHDNSRVLGFCCCKEGGWNHSFFPWCLVGVEQVFCLAGNLFPGTLTNWNRFCWVIIICAS